MNPPINPALIYLALFIIGLIIGSFLNVIIYRLPNDLSIVKPRSHCPSCKEPIQMKDNIPLLSFILLHGKCRYCPEKINLRYPFVETLAGILSVLLYSIYGFSLLFILLLSLTYMLIAITFIDFDHYIIPNEFVLIFLGLAVVAHGLNLIPINWKVGLMGAFGFGGALFLLGILGNWIFKKEAMGFGDVKLGFVLGAFLGIEWSDLTLFISFITAAFFSIVLLVLNKISRENPIPFGPFISAGAIITWLSQTPGGGNYILNWYYTTMF